MFVSAILIPTYMTPGSMLLALGLYACQPILSSDIRASSPCQCARAKKGLFIKYD